MFMILERISRSGYFRGLNMKILPNIFPHIANCEKQCYNDENSSPTYTRMSV